MMRLYSLACVAFIAVCVSSVSAGFFTTQFDVMQVYQNEAAQCQGEPQVIFAADTSICDAACVALAQVLDGDQDNDACQDGSLCISSNNAQPIGTADGFATVDCDAVVTPSLESAVRIEFYSSGCCSFDPYAYLEVSSSLFPIEIPQYATECIPQLPIPSELLPDPENKDECGSLMVIWDPDQLEITMNQYGSGCDSGFPDLLCLGSVVATKSYRLDVPCQPFEVEGTGNYSVKVRWTSQDIINQTKLCSGASPLAGSSVVLGLWDAVLALVPSFN